MLLTYTPPARKRIRSTGKFAPITFDARVKQQPKIFSKTRAFDAPAKKQPKIFSKNELELLRVMKEYPRFYKGTNPYKTGINYLRFASLPTSRFSEKEIYYIGVCDALHINVVIGKVGNHWMIKDFDEQNETPATFRPYYIIGNGYMNVLHKSYAIEQREMMRRFETKDTSKRIDIATTDDIFFAGKEKKPSRRRAAKIHLSKRIEYSERMERIRAKKAKTESNNQK